MQPHMKCPLTLDTRGVRMLISAHLAQVMEKVD